MPSYKKRRKGGHSFPGFTSTDNSEVSSSPQDTSPEANDTRRPLDYQTSPYSVLSSGSTESGISYGNRRTVCLNGEKGSDSSTTENQKQTTGNPEVLRIRRELVELESDRKVTMRMIQKLKSQMDNERQVCNVDRKVQYQVAL